LYFFHSLEIDDRGAMDAKKPGRIELRFEFRHCFAKQMSFDAGMQIDVVIRCFNPIDFFRFHKEDPAVFLYQETVDVRITGRFLLLAAVFG
jgi:hypothetical protein